MPADRTEKATPHRHAKARKDGDILRSRELSSAAGTLAGVLCLGFLGQEIIGGFRSALREALNLGSARTLGAVDTLKCIGQTVIGCSGAQEVRLIHCATRRGNYLQNVVAGNY